MSVAFEKAVQLAEEVKNFPLHKCGPSDDPDKQYAYARGFRDLTVNFIGAIKRIGDVNLIKLIPSVDTSDNDIYSAHEMKAQLTVLIDALEEKKEKGMTDNSLIAIPATFIAHAASILGETNQGLSGSKIVEIFSAYAVDFDVNIPYSRYPFPTDIGNKRTALRDNLMAFSATQQFQIINELCSLDHFKNNSDAKDLRIKLITRFGSLSAGADSANEPLIAETKHWLGDYPESLKLFNEALNKFETEIYLRNLLDDLRLSLELLLKSILVNDKSMENQLGALGDFIGKRKGSKELNNMFVKLIDYYSKYQNTYVKHDDRIIENEIEIILEMTCSFMKFLIRIK